MNTTVLRLWWPSSLGMGMSLSLQQRRETFRKTCWPWMLPLASCWFAVPFQVLSFFSISNNRLFKELSRFDLEEALGQRYPKRSHNRRKPWTEPFWWRNFSQGTASPYKFWLDLHISQIQHNQVLQHVLEPRTEYKDRLSFPVQVRQWQNSQYKINMTDSALLQSLLIYWSDS